MVLYTSIEQWCASSGDAHKVWLDGDAKVSLARVSLVAPKFPPEYKSATTLRVFFKSAQFSSVLFACGSIHQIFSRK